MDRKEEKQRTRHDEKKSKEHKHKKYRAYNDKTSKEHKVKSENDKESVQFGGKHERITETKKALIKSGNRIKKARK